ncbi:MAG: tRNA (guanosine(46)-N7)-methyltransferase TrmB [Anaerolineae bacterium]
MQKRSYNSLTMAWPTDWSALFGAERPLIVEIGFGNGEHLLALAKAHPNCNVIGFEISVQSIEKAEKKIRRSGLKNVIAIHSRGETAIFHLFRPQSIREIHINYPDPWFKARHAGRRIMQRDMLDAMVSRLEIGGLFYLATDIVEYAEMSDDLLRDTSGLSNELAQSWVNELDERLIVTKYEEKGLREGRVGNYFKYRRNTHTSPEIPTMEEWPVPHVILKTPMTPQTIASQVEREAFHKNDRIHVAVFNGFWNIAHNSVLFEINIEEATIEQHVALSLRYRPENDDYILHYATFGMPRPTEGLHFATSALAEWIVSLHPDAEIVADRTRSI